MFTWTPLDAIARAKAARNANTKAAIARAKAAKHEAERNYRLKLWQPVLDAWVTELEQNYHPSDYELIMAIAALCGNGKTGTRAARTVTTVDKRHVVVTLIDGQQIAGPKNAVTTHVCAAIGKKPQSLAWLRDVVPMLEAHPNVFASWTYVEA